MNAFEFNNDTYDKAQEVMRGLLAQAHDKDYPIDPVGDLFDALKPFIQEQFAAEYDRGYETALNMEVQPAKATAWERGVAEGVRYGQASIQTNTYYDESRIKKPVNPYLRPATPDDSVAPNASG